MPRRVNHQRMKLQGVRVAAHGADPAAHRRAVHGRQREPLFIRQEGRRLGLRLARRLVGRSSDGLAQDASRLASLRPAQAIEPDDVHARNC
jgi:hypothetical protein